MALSILPYLLTAAVKKIGVENMQDNLYAPIVLASVCKKYGKHFRKIISKNYQDSLTKEDRVKINEKINHNELVIEFNKRQQFIPQNNRKIHYHMNNKINYPINQSFNRVKMNSTMQNIMNIKF
jgi:hypothetical protein